MQVKSIWVSTELDVVGKEQYHKSNAARTTACRSIRMTRLERVMLRGCASPSTPIAYAWLDNSVGRRCP